MVRMGIARVSLLLDMEMMGTAFGEMVKSESLYIGVDGRKLWMRYGTGMMEVTSGVTI